MYIIPLIAGLSFLSTGYLVSKLFEREGEVQSSSNQMSQLITLLLLSSGFCVVSGKLKVFPISFLSLLSLSLVTKRRRRRKLTRQVVNELPFVSLSLSLMIEGGLSIQSALSKLSDSYAKSVSGNLLMELKNLIETGTDVEKSKTILIRKYGSHYMETLIEALITGADLGNSPSHTLREISDRILYDRVVKAEENSLKAPVKLLIPLCFFIFPAIFLMIFSPLIIQLAAFQP